jgi:DNA-binding Lrp family transcriptional regulator
MGSVDGLDRLLLLALSRNPRATVVSLAEEVSASRNTVHARLSRMERDGTLRSFEHRVDPAGLGFPLTAFVLVVVTQRQLDQVGEAFAKIPEILEVTGISGATDLLVRVAGRDADHLYQVAAKILATDGVERTEVSLAMRELVPYRVVPLLESMAAEAPSRP